MTRTSMTTTSNPEQQAFVMPVATDEVVIDMPARMTMMTRRRVRAATHDSSPRMTMSRAADETANRERA